MKILLISFSHYPTLQNYIYLLKANLLSRCDEIYSLGNSKIATTYDTLQNSYFANCIDNASPSFSNIKLFMKQKKRICKTIDNINPDAILFTSKHIWNVFLIFHLKIKDRKIFHVFHDPIGHSGTTVSRGVIIYNKIISKLLNGIIVHSDVSMKKTLAFIKPKCGIIKVPLGEKKWLPYQDRKFYTHKLLVFGRISTYKGYEFIPELARQLKIKNINCTIVIAGKALDDVDKNIINKIKSFENIELHDHFIPEEQLDDFFYNTDATLLLHKSISQSGVIVDAYRHGHPVICFNIEGISEFINNKASFTASKFNIVEMVDYIKDMYSDFNKYKKMSQYAYKFGKTIFSDQTMADKIFQFISKRII